MKLPIVAGIAGMLALTGCAQPDPALLAAAQQPVRCSGKLDCNAKWSRAVNWIAMHGHYQIRIQTAYTVATEGPIGSEVWAAMEATRQMNPDGSGDIHFASGCNNMFGCSPMPLPAEAAFKTYVNEVN